MGSLESKASPCNFSMNQDPILSSLQSQLASTESVVAATEIAELAKDGNTLQ